MPLADPQPNQSPTPPAVDAGDVRPRQPFQFRLRTLFLVTTVLCLLLTIPAMGWLLGYLAAYIALSFAGVGVLVALHAALFLLLDALGWLPTRRDRDEG